MSKATKTASSNEETIHYYRSSTEFVCENDDLLLEIFFRLSDLRSAIRFSSVSKHCLSLIRNPNIFRSFINHRRRYHAALPPYAFLFQCRHIKPLSNRPGKECVTELYQLFSEESEIFHTLANIIKNPVRSPSDRYLDFIPELIGEKAIKARFGDLLLISGVIESANKYYICNGLTKQWLALPEAPPKPEGVGQFSHRDGLVCKQNMDSQRQEFRVVLFHTNGSDGENVVKAVVFSSETWRWSVSSVEKPLVGPDECYAVVHPWNNGGVVAARGGVLHFLMDILLSSRCVLVSFDPFKEDGSRQKWRFIDFPVDLRPLYVVNEWVGKYYDFPRSVNLHLGACQGRLRLAQWPVGDYYSEKDRAEGSSGDGRSARREALKVWELSDSDAGAEGVLEWRLVHEGSVEGKGIRHVVGLHPENGDVMLVYCEDRSVCEYNVKEQKLRVIGEFPVRLEDYPLIGAVSAIPLMHSYDWPTVFP